MNIQHRFRNAVPEQYELFEKPKPNKWRFVPIVVIAFCLALVSATAFADTFKREREFLDYIKKHTGMETSHILPRYEYWTFERLNQVYYGDQYKGQRNVLALAIGGVIMLPYFFDEVAQPEVLLHELFHVAVFENDVKYQCLGEEERMAYALQDKFVEEQGWGMKSDPFRVFFMQCHHLIPR